MRRILLLMTVAALLGTGCNDFKLFGGGGGTNVTPDKEPPNWDDSYGEDKYFYFWRVVANQAGEDKGTIFRKNIFNEEPPEPFWVSPNGKCVGCHSVSPEGRYMAVVELTFRLGLDPTVHIVDIATQTEIDMPTGPLTGTFTSWNPNPDTDPPDQFVMASPFGLQIASPTTGIIRTLFETSTDGAVATYPSWGPDGRIAYARGLYGDPRLILYEESEIWTINEDGTDPSKLVGEPGMMLYFPAWNPSGRWIAYTQAPPDSVTGTIANPNGQILIFDIQDNVVINPDDLNNAVNGGKSWPTWSAVGNRLTCGSIEDEGTDSDVYITHFDPNSGLDWEAERIDIISTPKFEHIPHWAP